jgi:hypothetical protein
MATQSGASYDLRKVDLVIGAGFRVDALDAAGIAVAWQGDQFTVAPGADNINVIVGGGSTQAIITVSNMQSARFLDYVTAWLEVGDARPLSLEDRSGRTILAEARAIPRQQPNMTFTNTHSPRAIDIHCPNLSGTVGGLNDG